MRCTALMAGFVLTSMPAHAAEAGLALAPIWGDHAVIQRDRPIMVEGWTAPKRAVSASLGEAHASGTSDPSGHFALRFPARPASDAGVTLTVSAGSDTAKASDLLVGDVWLCSGQSNMEYPVARALNGPGEVAAAGDGGLRLLTVPKTIAMQPRTSFGGPVSWAASSPQTAANFSAACYFMARDLRKALHVPIGAIHSSWGGSQARAWLSPQAGLKLYGAEDMAMLQAFARDKLDAVSRFAPRWQEWYRGATRGSEPWRQPDSLAWSAVPKISGWLGWEGTPLATKATGTIWLRRQITLTPEQAAAGAALKLGVLDDMDMTFVNGHPVGNSFGWDYERDYAVPPAYLHPGVNEIMVAVTNSYADGGFQSKPEVLLLAIKGGASIPLAEGWRFSISGAQTYPPRAPWDANGGIGVMHNNMIAPLGALALKGVAWYQGESDVDEPGYRQRLSALIDGWRGQFGTDVRVLVVQLANYGPVQKGAVASNTARLRDDQRFVAAQAPGAALVTAIDLGESSDIHPANKETLGDRLALAARGVPMPMPLSAQREGSAIRLRFSGVEGGLHAWSGVGPLGFELCGHDGRDCRLVAATVEGDSVLLPDAGDAEVVRYAWADSPRVNLYDGRDLPVPGFEMAVTDR
ncbi:sialate O-acetylesterase [Novosphingobium terrae]|uniref:sialate O-acetylesterase n=1 Tax=Novosphingobium terrae TaxID=2726189 RepID=UPI001F136057|nr:sialate O-acetylesterase [Novosphingobium terrae]